MFFGTDAPFRLLSSAAMRSVTPTRGCRPGTPDVVCEGIPGQEPCFYVMCVGKPREGNEALTPTQRRDWMCFLLSMWETRAAQK